MFTPSPNFRQFTTSRPVKFRVRGTYWTVPAGTVTDGASIPRLFWSLLPPLGRYGYAALLHDYLYQTGAVSRKETDLVFLAHMKQLGVPFPVRWAMFLAVRGFGWAYARTQFNPPSRAVAFALHVRRRLRRCTLWSQKSHP